MDVIYFLVRHMPFWAFPCFLLGLEFAYIGWLRKKKKLILTCAIISAFSAVCLVYYYWAGGPEKSVKLLIKMVHFYDS
jgi:ammonia channel protein AmtB